MPVYYLLLKVCQQITFSTRQWRNVIRYRGNSATTITALYLCWFHGNTV